MENSSKKIDHSTPASIIVDLELPYLTQPEYCQLTKATFLSSDPVVMATIQPQETLDPEEIRTTDQQQHWLERNVYFDDKKRKIDFILVYKASDNPISDSQKMRDSFEASLIGMGVELELQDKELSPSKNTYFLKLHASDAVLHKFAEYLAIRVPIERQASESVSLYQRLSSSLKINKITSLFEPKISEQFQIGEFYTSPYSKAKHGKFLSEAYSPPTEDVVLRDAAPARRLFSDSQRTMIMHYILSIASFTDPDSKKERAGLERLLSSGGYSCGYPLHDGPALLHKGQKQPDCYRQFLYREWGSPFAFYKSQPLDQIREYFGDKIAIYFAFLGLYTRWLFYASVFGILIFIYGLLTIVIPVLNPSKSDVCGADPVEFYMCPLCEGRCDFWFLSSSCLATWFVKLFDNEGTILFAIFTAFWAILFLESWKRNIATLKYEWDLSEFKDEEEHPRPEYENKLRNRYESCNLTWYRNIIQKINPITQDSEFFQPTGELFVKVMGSFVALLTLVTLALGLVIGVIAYKVIVKTLLTVEIGKAARANNVPISPSIGSFIVTLTAAVLNLIFIGFMQIIYKFLATWLTNWELHRTESEHEDSFTLKMFLFQCINYYSSIFYVAFIKGKVLVEYPGRDSGTLFLLEECETYGCFLDLCIQLVVIFLGKQLINNFLELGLPLLKIFIKWGYRKLISRKNKSIEIQALDDYYARWEREEVLDIGRSHYLFYEYLELVIQFGFVTLFVAAFPLAPFFAFLNNIVEIRLDAYKFLVLSRRYVPFRAADIGIWLTFLDVMAKICVLSNAFLITFTGTTLDEYVYAINKPNDNRWLDGYTNFSLSAIPCAELNMTNHFPSMNFESISCQGAESVGVTNASMGPYCFDLPYSDGSLYQPYFQESIECCANSSTTGCARWTNTTPTLNQSCCDAMWLNLDNNPIPASSINSLLSPPVNSSYLTNETCSVKRVNNECFCRYRGRFSPDPYKPNDQYYFILALWKLIFIILFENLIFISTGFLAWIIPDVPHSIRIQIKREQLLTNKILFSL